MVHAYPELKPAQIENVKLGLRAAAEWAKAKNKDVTAVQERLIFAAWTESRFRNLANNGNAFAPNAKLTSWNEGLTAEQCRVIRYQLRTSMLLPTADKDDTGENGGSTGWLQQLSGTYVMERFGKTWGYGTIADTMDVYKSSWMFLDRLVITNSKSYKPSDGNAFDLSDPIARDVLTVQKPLLREALSDNYDEHQVAYAKKIVAKYAGGDQPSPPPPTMTNGWFSRILKK